MRRRKHNPCKAAGEVLRGEYRDRCEGVDEIALWVGVTWDRDGRLVAVQPGHEPRAAAIHEIWSPGGTRPLLWSNFIALGWDPHNRDHFGTKGEPVSARMLSMLAKCRKRAETLKQFEFHIPEIDQCAGDKSVLGWVEGLRFMCPFLTAFQFETVTRLATFTFQDQGDSHEHRH